MEEEQGGEGRVEEEQDENGEVDEGQESEVDYAESLDPEVLKDEVVSLRQRVEELTQQLMRLQADFDNYRKRRRWICRKRLSEPMRSWSDSFCRYWIIWKGHWR